MERRELPRYPVIDIAATGQNLRRLRLEKGYSVKELQEYLGLGCPQGVYQWQAGRSLPSVDNLYAVSRLWGVSMNEILVEMLMYGREAQSKTRIASPATIPKSGERNRKIHSCMLYLISI